MFRYALLIAAAFAPPLAAQTPPNGFSAGIVATASTSALKGEDDSVMVVPAIRYQGDGFNIGPLSASLRVMERDNLTVNLRAAPRLSAIDQADSDFLNGMSRDLTLDIGLGGELELAETTSLKFELMQEVTGEHDGQEISVSLRHTVKLGPVPVGLSVGAAWQSDALAGYLYGVNADEARSSRPAYDPGDALVTSFGIDSGFPLAKNVFLLGQFGVQMLPYEATESSIIESDSTTRFSLGLIYLF